MGLHHSPRIVTNGLLFCWDPGNTKSYPGSGTTITDLSGNGRHATLLNGTTISNGTMGCTTRNHCARLQAQDYSAYSNITVDMWYKRNGVNDTGTGGAGLPTYYQGVFNYYWEHYIYVGLGNDATSTNLTIFTVSTTLALNTWVHIVGITGSGGAAGYINGNLIGTNAGQALTTSRDVYIGNYDTSWASFCNIGPTKVYNRALTAAEIKQSFNSTRGRYGI